MFGITYKTWKQICDMYFSLRIETLKAYLQWFPFSKLTDDDKNEMSGEEFYQKYISTGGFVLFPEVMRHSENFIQKSDGSFRNSTLVSPIFYLVFQAIGKEVFNRYSSQRPVDVGVFYAGNYEFNRPRYKQDYDDFFKEINAGAEQYRYFIKTDITNFFGSINVDELIDRINEICNCAFQTISQTQLLLLKELILYCGDGYYPLIENSMASSYMATVIYLDAVDCELHEYINSKINDITAFRMIRYVDDLYILFSSDNKSIDQLIPVYNTIRNEYSSILKKHSLAINTNKCDFGETIRINEELKKSLYDEIVFGKETDIGGFFFGKLESFLREIYETLCNRGLTNEQYSKLIEKHFISEDIEYTPEEVYNYLVYENQTELRQPEVSKLLVRIIKTDVTFLSIDPKRLSVMVMQSGNDNTVKEMLNQLFNRYRVGVWNSYDTTIAIAYLIQSKFRHIDLLSVIRRNCPDLYLFYFYGCRSSFICQIRNEKRNRYLRCIGSDTKANFLFFMSICENNRFNYLGSYAYYKNFFDRISADMAFRAGVDPTCKKPNYNRYYNKGEFKAMYSGIADSDEIIEKAHKIRNENPLSHSSAGLIDSDSTSRDLEDTKIKLDFLLDQYSISKQL